MNHICDICNDVDHKHTPDFLQRLCAENLCTVFKNPVHVKHEKCIFVPRGVCSRMRTINIDLITQKGSQVVQMIILHKNVHIIYILIRRE